MSSKVCAFLIVVLLLITGAVLAEFMDMIEQGLPQEDEVVAEVDGEEISRKELEEIADLEQLVGYLSQLNQQFVQVLNNTEAGLEFINRYLKEILNEIIDEYLLLNEVEKRELTISSEEMDEIFQQEIEMILIQNNLTEEELIPVLQQHGIASLDDYKDLVIDEEMLLISKLLEEEVFGEITIDSAIIEQVYESNKAQFVQEKQVKVRHILVENKQEAEDIYQKLKAGENFAQMAQKFSIDEFTAESGGELGYVSKGELGKEFDQLAFELEIDEISKPIETQFAYQIIKVEDKIEAGILPLTEVEDDIRNSLIQQEQQQVYLDYLKELREKAEIKIYL